MEHLGTKVPSAESIGACSLDVEASESQNLDWSRLAKEVSEMTLKSAAVSGEGSGNPSLRRHGTPEGAAVQLSNRCFKVGDSTVEGWPTTTIEHKPSYLNVSCAVNGYTSYSQFCRSRDPSPAACSVQKPSLLTGTMAFQGKPAAVNGRYGGTVNRKQEPICASRSLVQQRIATLYGAEAAERVARSRTRMSTSPMKWDAAAGKRSLSCSVHSVRRRSCSPPVFKHLTRNFKEHLRLSEVTASPVQSLPGHTAQSTDMPSFLNAEGKRLIDSENAGGTKCRLNSGVVDSGQHPDMLYCGTLEDNRINGSEQAATLPDKCESDLPPMKPLGAKELSIIALSEPLPQKEGYAFLETLEATQKSLAARIRDAENDLTQPDLPEEARGHLLSAVGKANLLLAQKMKQFRELCQKNINPRADDSFEATGPDLAGFWDMVMLQVDQVNEVFDSLAAMKQNNWLEHVKVKAPKTKTASKLAKQAGSRSVPASSRYSAKAEEAARIRAEARKRLMEAKAAAKQSGGSGEADIEIFVPHKREKP